MTSSLSSAKMEGMTQIQERADRIGVILQTLYPNPRMPLHYRNNYTMLVAVMLSAQTTDKKVNEITPLLFDVASTPEQMYYLTVEEIHHYIKQVGLAPTKARNLSDMARMLVEDFETIRPDWDFLESLPGVGHKTASVVMAEAFGVPAFPVDTHIKRLANRWGLADTENVAKVEERLKAVFPEDTWNRRHLQMIYFGRNFCPAKRHDAIICPICSWIPLTS